MLAPDIILSNTALSAPKVICYFIRPQVIRYRICVAIRSGVYLYSNVVFAPNPYVFLTAKAVHECIHNKRLKYRLIGRAKIQKELEVRKK